LSKISNYFSKNCCQVIHKWWYGNESRKCVSF